MDERYGCKELILFLLFSKRLLIAVGKILYAGLYAYHQTKDLAQSNPNEQ